jgi:hypothetical protein
MALNISWWEASHLSIKRSRTATHAALAEFGASLTGIRPEDFTHRNSFFRFGRPPKGFDILPVILGVDFDAATGLGANFISADDLIASKPASERPQDLADADAIRKARASQRPDAKDSSTRGEEDQNRETLVNECARAEKGKF